MCLSEKFESAEIIESIVRYLQEKSFEKASSLLIESSNHLLADGDWPSVRHVLDIYPRDWILRTPDLMYIEGQVCIREERLTDASYFLERARQLFFKIKDVSGEIKCCLELARVCQRREDFRTAKHYIKDAEKLLQDSALTDLALQAHFWFRMASLCPDIGQLQKGVEYGEKALELFKQGGNVKGQFEALILLSLVTRQLGDYQESASWLEMARQHCLAAHLDKSLYIQTLHAEAHIEWYKGNIADALKIEQKAKAGADRLGKSKLRSWTTLVLGNLYRTVGDYETTRRLYAEAKAITEELQDKGFRPWIDVNTAWLEVLEGRTGIARGLLDAVLVVTKDEGLRASFNVFRGVLNIIDKRFADAEELLVKSLEYYLKSGDLLSVSNIRFYMAYIYLNTGHKQEANEYLTRALRWAEEKGVDYFPLWWYPAILSEVCAHALEDNLYPNAVEVMFIKHLRRDGISALRHLLIHPSESVRRRTCDILEAIGEEPFGESLNCVRDRYVREVLRDLIRSGRLKADGFDRLRNKLKTAHRHDVTNGTLLATFGLYVHGSTRREIADALDKAEPTIRHYITQIYDIFGLYYRNFESRYERKQKLREIAQREGFICEWSLLGEKGKNIELDIRTFIP